MPIDMQNELKKEISKYLKNIKHLLPGDSGSKRKYIKGLKEQIYDFADESDDISFHDILLYFGEEKDIAQEYIEILDINTVKRKLGIKRVVSVVLVIALLVWSVSATAGAFLSRCDADEGYAVITETIEGV